jgi:hypothetical protein
VEEKLNERAPESAEQVLARLERYVEAHRALPVVAQFVASPALAPSPAPAVDTLIPSRHPSREEALPRRHRFSLEVAPALITVAICSFVILLSELFDPAFAVVVAVVLAPIGVVGLVRRVPLARAYTFGLVLAALLVRFS